MPAATLADVRRARRILVFGATGSGKSTFTLELGRRLGLPVTLVDDLAWDPGWRMAPPQVLDARVLPRYAAPAWVIDTVYGAHRERALAAADVVVGLDYPRLVSLGRLVRRTARRALTGEPCCGGNTETVARALSRDSIIRWHFRSWAAKRATMRGWAAARQGPPVLLLDRPADADALLASLATLDA